jgi:hypothetical protein
MDDAAAEVLRKYARGELTSRAVRDETGLDYSEILAGLGRLGLRPPVASFDGINGPALRRGVAVLLEALAEHTP